jgi:hypothetical protein
VSIAKVGRNLGQFPAVPVRITDRWAPGENRLNNVGAGDMGVQYVPFSKSKSKSRTMEAFSVDAQAPGNPD